MPTVFSKTFRLTLAAAWFAQVSPAASGVQVIAGLSPDTIYFGTQTILTVSVEGDVGQWPSVETVEGVQITRYGSPSVIRDLISGTVQRSYRFLVNPSRPGTFQIPAVTVRIGEETITRGPFTLQVKEAPIRCLVAELDPKETLVSRPVKLILAFQGYRPGARLVLPSIEGLTITSTGDPQVRQDNQGVPVRVFSCQVTASKLGTFQIKGISFAGVPADEVTLTVSPFVIDEARVSSQSLVVGEEATLQLYTLGLEADAGLALVAPPGLEIRSLGGPAKGEKGTIVFSFAVRGLEPGNPVITTVKLGDGRQVSLRQPVSFSVRQSGEGGILAFTGKARNDESALGEPFIVDYDVYYRGNLVAAALDLSKARFADKPYIKVEPVNDLAYPDWQGRPMQIELVPEGKLTVQVGSGEYEGQKEQRIRFALKITPLAAGEVPLTGVRVILRLQVSIRRQNVGFVFRSDTTNDYDRVADLPPHRVVDPRGKTAPAGYRGAVGANFTFVTSLDRTTAAAMSPLMLTMRITGESVGPQFQPPPLTEVAELTRDFEVSPTVSGGEIEGNTITFTQIIRPRSERVSELPALPLVFYNYQKQQYETAYSLPIPIEVRAGSLVGAQAMQVGSGTQPASEVAVASDRVKDQPVAALGANFSSLGSLVRAEPLGLTGLLLILVGGPAVVLLVRVGYVVFEQRRPMSEVRRERARLLTLLDRLGEAERFHFELAEIVQTFLRLTFGLPPGEISADDLGRLLDERRAGSELRTAALSLLAECDAGRFAVGAVEQVEKERLIRQAREVLKKIERLGRN
ncbi:MAG: BatD family protein [Phycisphaerae bacterium]